MLTGCGAERSEKDIKLASDDKKIEQEADVPTNVIVASSGTYYPFGFMEEGKPKGFEIDIWDEIGKRTGLTVERKFAAYSGLFGMLDKGEIDTIANQVSKTPEREEKYIFSAPYAYSLPKIVVKKGNPENIHTLDDLIGKKVIVATGAREGDVINELYPNGEITVVPYEGEELLDVENGKMPAAITTESATAVAIKDQNRDVEIVGPPIYIEENAYVFAKTERGEYLQKKVDAAVKEMREDGTLKRLSEKWFGIDITTPPDVEPVAK
ncbi:transporter substrate-binding domain-containing protein [Tissierella praeacuta]|uniref:transporter substrate-binding domain-containing protein n=1 Tax=Tissierella praeacuta TaxID=43131 RepID=UPI003341C942